MQWYIGLVVKNNLYHDGELIQEMGPTFTGRKYFADDNGHFEECYEKSSSKILRNLYFEEYYGRSSSKILRNLLKFATHNNRWAIEKIVYIYVKIKNM